MKNPLLSLLLLLFTATASAEDASIARLFAAHQLQGTLLIRSLNSGQRFVHNDTRAAQRWPAASTFKIFNTLIALQERAVTSQDDVFKWDGKQHAMADWNHDQTLASAYKVSCVWCYQQLAEKIGADKYRHYLQQAHYGELREPFATTTFWLDGSLQISAIEQVAFLQQIYQRKLPFSPQAYATLKQIMLAQQTSSYRLYAKTGWATSSTPQVGWYVGYVETAKDVWFFAANLDISNASQLPLRLSVTRAALQAKGILD